MQMPNYNSNLAYDLSRFDVAEQKTESTPRREKQEQAKQELRLNSRSVSKSGSRLMLVAISVCVFVGLYFVNNFNTAAEDAKRLVTEQQALLTAAQEENSLLQTKLDSKMNNIGYIEEYATARLGMAKVSNTQVQYLKVNTESLIEIQPDGDGTLYETVTDWWGDVLEYIGL